MRLILGLQLLFFVSACSNSFAFADDKPAKPEKEIAACRVTLGLADAGKQLELLLTDPKLVEKLVLRPLLKSKEDPVQHVMSIWRQ
jgi:hypothetical protein